MIKNKYIILPFLFAAWTIIFAHSIIPHHHHSELNSLGKNHCQHQHHESYNHQNDFSVNTEFDCCDHNENGHVCHFKVEVLSQVSIDNIFICAQKNTLYSNLSCEKTNHNSFYHDIVSEEFPKTNYLRGPPLIA